MPAWLFVIAGIALVYTEGAVLASLGLLGAAQCAVILTVYLGIMRPFDSAALTLALMLLPFEWASGTVSGLYSLGLVAIFLGLRLASAWFPREWGPQHAMVCAAAAGVHHLWLAALWALTQPTLSAAVFWSLPGAVFWCGLVSWPVGAVLARLDQRLDPRRAAGASGLS